MSALLVPWLGNVVCPWPYQSTFLAAGSTYDVSPYVLAAVARAESHFDPAARSRRGAVGVMQLLPGTAAYLTDKNESQVVTLLEQPGFSIDVGAKYLAQLRGEFQSMTAAIAAYNGGDATVRSWIASGVWRPGESPKRIPFPETAAFVERVRRYARWYAFLYPGRDHVGK